MKYSSPKKRRKLLSMFVGGAILLAGVLIWIYHSQAPAEAPKHDSQTINYAPPSKEESETGESIKKNANSNTNSQPPSATPPDNTQQSTAGMEITATTQDTNSLYVRTLIQTVTSSGTCTLIMHGPGSRTYTTTSPVQPLPNTSTCAGFNIPISKLSAGTWSLLIKFANSSTSASVSKEVTVK